MNIPLQPSLQTSLQPGLKSPASLGFRPAGAPQLAATPGLLAPPERLPNDQFNLRTPTITGSAVQNILFAKPLSLPIYTTYATPDAVTIRGRAIEDETRTPESEDSWYDNLRRTAKQLESDEIPGLKLEVEFRGQTYPVTTDKEGFFELALKPNPPLPPGSHAVSVRLAEPSKQYWALPGHGQVKVHETQSRSVGVVSDIDDTILQTHVTSKAKLVKNMLFKNARELSPTPGMATLYNALERHLDQRIDGDIHYLSGSPVNLHERLGDFMALNGFPEGSIDLKHLGSGPNTDKLFAQDGYKLEKLRKLFETYPQRQFILIGDSGEKDPEIYRQIQQEFPAQVLGVMINNVTADKSSDARYAGQLLFDRTAQAAELAYAKGWIDAEGLRQVQQAETRQP